MPRIEMPSRCSSIMVKLRSNKTSAIDLLCFSATCSYEEDTPWPHRMMR